MTNHLQISRPAFSSFLKAEVAEFANKTIIIVGNKNPDQLLINPVFEPLRSLGSEIDLLTIRYGMDPHRAKVENLKSKLMLTVSTLKLEVRLLSKAGVDEELHTIKNMIDTYLRYLNAPKKNDKVVVQQVQGFLNEVSTNTDFANAIDKHVLIGSITAIEAALENYREAINTRLEFRAQRPTVNTSQIVAKVREAVHTLFKGIEVAQLVNSELDYEPLIDELNELVSNYRLSARLRAAYNKRMAEEKKDNTPDNEDFDEGANNEEQPTPTSTRSNSGFAPYRLSVVSMNNADDTQDDETLDDEYEEENVDNELNDEVNTELEGDDEFVEA